MDSNTTKALVTAIVFLAFVIFVLVINRYARRGVDSYDKRLRQREARPISDMRYRRLWVIDRDESGLDDSKEEQR